MRLYPVSNFDVRFLDGCNDDILCTEPVLMKQRQLDSMPENDASDTGEIIAIIEITEGYSVNEN